MSKAISKKKIVDELWRRGNLSFKLDAMQMELYKLFHDTEHKVQTWLLARRSGKSYTLCVLALEQCIKFPNSIVKFVSPTKLQVNNNLRPLLKQILEDCPSDVVPEFRVKDYIYYFPNGSEIQLSGTDSGHAEKLRGGDSHIAIIDEAGSCNELNYLVRSILLPTTLITKGKVLLASTPPREPDHEFLGFIEEAEARNSLIKKTIYDNVRLTDESRNELINELGGLETEDAKRELLCELIKDSNKTVIPEATDELMKEIVKDWPMAPHFDSYVSMDIGFKDKTVVLFGYYDFRAAKLIFQDEIVINGPEMRLPELASNILKKEEALWVNVYTSEIRRPHKRVSDIDHIVINELWQHSNKQLHFSTITRDNKEAAVNDFRTLLNAKRIIIHPRCVTLIRHIKNAKWRKSGVKTLFGRSPDDGHYDALDAAIYMARNIDYNKNPYPTTYGMNMQDLYMPNPEKYKSHTDMNIYKTIFNIKGKK